MDGEGKQDIDMQKAGPSKVEHVHVTKTRFRIAVRKETPVSPAP